MEAVQSNKTKISFCDFKNTNFGHFFDGLIPKEIIRKKLRVRFPGNPVPNIRDSLNDETDMITPREYVISVTLN